MYDPKNYFRLLTLLFLFCTLQIRAGWVYINTYSNCGSGEVLRVEAFKSGTCVTIGSDSYTFTCQSGDNVLKEIWTSITACAGDPTSTATVAYTDCLEVGSSGKFEQFLCDQTQASDILNTTLSTSYGYYASDSTCSAGLNDASGIVLAGIYEHDVCFPDGSGTYEKRTCSSNTVTKTSGCSDSACTVGCSVSTETADGTCTSTSGVYLKDQCGGTYQEWADEMNNHAFNSGSSVSPSITVIVVSLLSLITLHWLN